MAVDANLYKEVEEDGRSICWPLTADALAFLSSSWYKVLIHVWYVFLIMLCYKMK